MTITTRAHAPTHPCPLDKRPSISAGPTAAGAATVTASSACVVAGRPTLQATTRGWAPGAALTFSLGDRAVGVRHADATGAFTTGSDPLSVPRLRVRRPIVSRSLRVRDASGAAARPVAVKVVRRSVALPPRARPSRRVRWRAYGFPRGRRLYLHVRRGGRTLASMRLGRPHGACGVLTARLRYVPLHRVQPGAYEYWFSTTRRYRAARTLYGLLVEA